MQRNAFVFAYRRSDFERDYGADYDKPRLFARFLGALYRIVPKIGPLKPLAFKAPTLEAQELFARSFRLATDRFRSAVLELSGGQFNLPNTDFDTGHSSQLGEYALADETYAELLNTMSKRRFDGVPDALKRNIRTFYASGTKRPPADRDEEKEWARVQLALQEMNTQGVPIVATP